MHCKKKILRYIWTIPCTVREKSCTIMEDSLHSKRKVLCYTYLEDSLHRDEDPPPPLPSLMARPFVDSLYTLYIRTTHWSSITVQIMQ
jgi:hypothetical protein